MKEFTDNSTLRAEMLGDFALYYKGESIPVGKSAGAKFHSLLGMLILSGGDGLHRDDIINSLFGADELANIGNSLNNLIYQVRGHIERSDLPAGCVIEKKRDKYFFKSEIPIETDADEFENLTANAGISDDITGKKKLLKRAISLYKGDLLPLADCDWVNERRNKYKKIFLKALSDLADIYKKDGDTDSLVNLYTEAENVFSYDPDGELDSALVKALIASGDKKKALRHYDRAVKKYQTHGSGNIPEKLDDCAKMLSLKSADLKSELTDVVNSDASDKDLLNGAFYCNYPSFIDAVRLARRNLNRDERPATLMLLTLVDYEGKPIKMEKKKLLYSDALAGSIRSTLRTGDSFTRHDETSFLLLLPGADEKNAVAIYDRIAENFKTSAGTNAGLRYRKLDLASL